MTGLNFTTVLHCFQIELSSVSAVHSDEEGLILHQSVRDVVSDEHIDLSKTRIDEHFVCISACWWQ